ncbi:hypothetical protein CEXT_456391 [Caerostris extrusa]|uniref:Uncharacterized protein n=1 Tax=Caerostris extrusa TaxID=172846 RepID=A0AAV4UZ06_CAEEX|nr:hypothetical protein CEXT_456391 [Caerostris extrusa]
MEFNPQTNNQDLSETTQNDNIGIRPVSPSGVSVSEDFLYDNMELIAELHTFQAQLEHLHNCMQAAPSNKQDAKLTAQTNELVLKVEGLINNRGIPLGKIPATPAEAEKIKVSVEERRNPKPSTSTAAQQAAKHTTKPSAVNADRHKKPKRRMEDEDGFIFPAKHLIARGTTAGAGKRPQISTTNSFLSTNPTPEVADEEVTPTEQSARK